MYLCIIKKIKKENALSKIIFDPRRNPRFKHEESSNSLAGGIINARRCRQKRGLKSLLIFPSAGETRNTINRDALIFTRTQRRSSREGAGLTLINCGQSAETTSPSYQR